MEDEKIVALYLSRDEAAIEETSKKYGSRLRALALGIVDDGPMAEECENDTYFQAWASIPPHEPKHYFYAFLARITRHVALNRCREQNSLKRSAYLCELSTELEQCLPAPDCIEQRLLMDTINAFLGTLSEQKRNVFVRRYWYLDSISAICERFALPQSKVKTMLFRCRKQLRQYLEKEGYSV